MKINYINIQGCLLAKNNNENLNHYINQAEQTFNLTISDIKNACIEGYKAIIACDRKKIKEIIKYTMRNQKQEIIDIAVDNQYKEENILDDLVNQAIYDLKNEQPIINIPITELELFKNIIEKYHWQKTSYTESFTTPKGMYGFNEFKLENKKNLSPQKKKYYQ